MFIDTLNELNRGDLVTELDTSIAELVEAVRTTGKKGHVTLKIAVNPASPDSEQVFLDAVVKEAFPKPQRAPTLFYTQSGGRLSRNDPRQTIMDLRTVEDPDTSKTRRVNGDNR